MNELALRGKDEYQWRAGSQFKIDPNIVGQRLEQLAEMGGGHITTDMIANEAQIPASPLYQLFEHDIESAAFEYQRVQARAIVNNLVIVTIIPAPRRPDATLQPTMITIDMETEDDQEETPIVARAFPSVTLAGERFYTPLQVVLRDGALRDQYMQRIHSELKALARKAKDFRIFSEVVNAIDSLPELATA